MKLQPSLIVIFLLLFSISCKKKNDPDPISTSFKDCYITQIRSDKSGMLRNIEYLNGKVSRVNTAWTSGNDILVYISELTYYNDSVVEAFKGPAFDQVITHKIGANGKIEISVHKNIDDATIGTPTTFKYDTTYFEYDADGYLIKRESINTLNSYININTTIFKIANGNVISETRSYNGTVVSTTTYEYYPDLMYRSGGGRNYELWPDDFGKPSKNLVKKVIDDNNTTEYFYQLDQNGNVVKVTTSVNGGPITTSIDKASYDCDQK